MGVVLALATAGTLAPSAQAQGPSSASLRASLVQKLDYNAQLRANYKNRIAELEQQIANQEQVIANLEKVAKTDRVKEQELEQAQETVASLRNDLEAAEADLVQAEIKLTQQDKLFRKKIEQIDAKNKQEATKPKEAPKPAVEPKKEVPVKKAEPAPKKVVEAPKKGAQPAPKKVDEKPAAPVKAAPAPQKPVKKQELPIASKPSLTPEKARLRQTLIEKLNHNSDLRKNFANRITELEQQIAIKEVEIEGLQGQSRNNRVKEQELERSQSELNSLKDELEKANAERDAAEIKLAQQDKLFRRKLKQIDPSYKG